jgi:hypothetical protein
MRRPYGHRPGGSRQKPLVKSMVYESRVGQISPRCRRAALISHNRPYGVHAYRRRLPAWSEMADKQFAIDNDLVGETLHFFSPMKCERRQ